MNDVSNGLAPFQINTIFVDTPGKGMNYTTGRCDQSCSITGEGKFFHYIKFIRQCYTLLSCCKKNFKKFCKCLQELWLAVDSL